MFSTLLSLTLTLAANSAAFQDDSAKPVDFNRQIRSILSENCFACHGPDEAKRKAGLRLDTKEGAFAALKSGEFAVVPGKPDESNLVFRVETDDPMALMPPKSSNKTLTPEQIALLRNWVEQGASWSNHWAFEVPKRPPVPETKNPAWVRNPIDAFILQRLEAAGLQPNTDTDKAALVRRVTLDLSGLPPTPAEVDAFLEDNSPDAYEKVVNRLLRTVHYGEHMGRIWLDIARYGDTHGLHLDNYREMWPYRDWVVRAFNANLPFDQFIIQQLAGDMLPDPTLDQKIASGFNRAHVTTNEGGSIEEEVYVRNVADRVDTTGTVFLGLTVGCARCHDHKYDPIRTKDYYQIFAFFNSCDANPMDGNAAKYPPFVQYPTSEEATELKRLQAIATDTKKQYTDALAKITYDDSVDATLNEFVERAEYVWVDDDLPPGAKPNDNKPWTLGASPDHPVLSGKSSVRNEYAVLGQQFFESARPLTIGEGDKLFAYVFIDPVNPPKEIMLQWNSGAWKHRAYWGENLIAFGADNTPERKSMGALPRTGEWVRLEVDASAVGLAPGTKVSGLAFTQQGGTAFWDKAGSVTWTPQEGQYYNTLSSWIRSQKALKLAGLPADVQAALKKPRAERTPEDKQKLIARFIEFGYDKTQQQLAPQREAIAKAEKDAREFDEKIPVTLVSEERKEPKPAFVLTRGDYDKRADQVQRDTPAFLPPLPPDAPKNRLTFARWLVAPEQPLTARVTVNRLWLHLFGTGLVKTAEDFGAQGEPPSHPELLDWLAVDFRESGWDVKRFIKQLVMSSTYRQAANASPDKLAKDPANRLLSRGPRFRLDAEVLRDQALAISQLLIDRPGGPGVKPPQPAGLWEAVGFVGSNTATFKADEGRDKVHRRSLYTFWKRTSPPPQMTTFDAPSREACSVRRERTNTPLQALLLMNEPQYVEASRGLAQRALTEAGSSDEDRVVYMFRLATARRPDTTELAGLTAALTDFRDHFKANTEAAKQLITTGETKPNASLDPTELAAWTMLGNTVLNLDEVINKP